MQVDIRFAGWLIAPDYLTKWRKNHTENPAAINQCPTIKLLEARQKNQQDNDLISIH